MSILSGQLLANSWPEASWLQRSCCQLFSLRRLSELVQAKQQRLYIAFVDLRKAFDSINRCGPALWTLADPRLA
jgi:hypothetical protein